MTALLTAAHIVGSGTGKGGESVKLSRHLDSNSSRLPLEAWACSPASPTSAQADSVAVYRGC